MLKPAIPAVPVWSGTIAAAFLVLAAAAGDPSQRTNLFFLGLFFGLISGGFVFVGESQRSRRKATLGEFLRRANDLARDCDNEFATDFEGTRKKCDILENEED